MNYISRLNKIVRLLKEQEDLTGEGIAVEWRNERLVFRPEERDFKRRWELYSDGRYFGDGEFLLNFIIKADERFIREIDERIKDYPELFDTLKEDMIKSLRDFDIEGFLILDRQDLYNALHLESIIDSEVDNLYEVLPDEIEGVEAEDIISEIFDRFFELNVEDFIKEYGSEIREGLESVISGAKSVEDIYEGIKDYHSSEVIIYYVPEWVSKKVGEAVEEYERARGIDLGRYLREKKEKVKMKRLRERVFLKKFK